jgi:Flp pilus assembly protein TadD
MPNISRSDFLKQELKKIQNLFLANKFVLVIEKSKKMIKKDPSQIPFYNYLALSYRELGKYNIAEEILQNALKMKPNTQSVLNNLGANYRAKGEYIEAEKYLEQALSNNPNDINALCNYANVKRDKN